MFQSAHLHSNARTGAGRREAGQDQEVDSEHLQEHETASVRAVGKGTVGGMAEWVR